MLVAKVLENVINVLNLADILVYRLRYMYFIQNDTINAKFYRIFFLDRYGQNIATWPIYGLMSEMNISDISPRDAFEELLQTHLRNFYKK